MVALTHVALSLSIGIVATAGSPLFVSAPTRAADVTAAAVTVAEDNALAGIDWMAVELAGKPIPPLKSTRAPHLMFQTDGRFSGSDGCNRLNGGYTLIGNGLTFKDVAGTKMACADVTDMERDFQAALKGTTHFSKVEKRLLLIGAAGRPLAIFEQRLQRPIAVAAVPAPGTV